MYDYMESPRVRYSRHNSPAEIKILLHFHCIPDPWPNPTDLSSDIIGMFIRDGILQPDDTHGSGFTTTEKGRAWVEMICSSPYPQQVWTNPLTGKAIKQ